MNFQLGKLKIMMLTALVVLGIIYTCLVHSQHTLTGINQWDGIIGVVLGLYICSHPAANLVDLLFYRRGHRYPFSSSRSAVLWLALNTMVLLIGGIVIFFGTTRLIGGTG
jgi:type IV secretory pathway VirB2 component (pilin)